MREINFKVGERYENRKGQFEVLTINGDQMEIRWQDGESMWTDMSFQRRVIRNMEFEEAQAKARAEAGSTAAAKRASRKRSGGGRFKGFLESDFSNSVSGTHWRSRAQLGGAVTQRLDPGPFRINSWPVYRMARVHWVDETHREKEDDALQGKFFASASPNGIQYGFFIERPPESDDSPWLDWDAFLEWLGTPENESWLRETAAAQELVLYDHNDNEKGECAFQGEIRADESGWRLDRADKAIPRLFEFLESLPPRKPGSLMIARRVEKDEAMARGADIANDIAGLFEILMPLYQAATSHFHR
ncbi:MAG: hypothetical protein ACLFQQ_14390 [Desulfococcaceae bacterium]